MKNQINAQIARNQREPLPDSYSLDELTFDQVLQLIEETAPYTDFLVLKTTYESSDKFCRELQGLGFYVKVLSNGLQAPWAEHPLEQDLYVLIRWTQKVI